MKGWLGRWVMAVGVVHSVTGLIAFRGIWNVLFTEGLFHAINGQPEREFPFWFVAVGLVTILLGAVVDWLEAGGSHRRRSSGGDCWR